jgi:hypothetical protein
MQKPVRYYITKSGDEPTVRSVAIALSPEERDGRQDGAAASSADVAGAREAEARRIGVTGRVKGAIKKRSDRA